MSSILTFPYKPVCLCIQKYPCPFVRIRRLLRDRSILCDHMNKFHIRYLCCDLISMADIIQCFDLLCFHRIFCQKTLVYNAEHGINISALQLIPRKRFHLISVMRINLTGFILISDQGWIQKRPFMEIQIISMHKVKIHGTRQCFIDSARLDRSHIKLVQLCNL